MERSGTGNKVLLCKQCMLMPNTAVTLVSHYSLSVVDQKIFTTEIQNSQNKVYNKQHSQEQQDSNSQTGRKQTSRRESVENSLFKTGQNFPCGFPKTNSGKKPAVLN